MTDTPWWKRAVIYQVYPRSFQDSDGDGVGDINGIRRRLDYLSWLGVGAIWISPIFPSPMADFGYDVSNYCAIAPQFGTMADFDALVSEARARGLKIILDFVPNHTSDRHPWFIESRASRSSTRRDWYIWHDGRGGADPNNWLSQFGGPAWTFDGKTGQYYLHSFLPQQPDLNWRNDAVRAAMLEVLRFWLDRGVDGFRVDALWLLIKDAALRDNPPNPGYQPTQPAINRTLALYNADQPEIHEAIAQMRAVLDGCGDRVLIGEIYLPFERLAAYYGNTDLAGAHLPFNFALIHARWDAAAIADLINAYEQSLPPGGWPNWVLGNHDQPRIAARVGAAQARIAAMLLLTLRGTPTMYYGDEIGLPRVDVPAELAQDPWQKREPGLGVGRDPSRTPMQWDATANAGFSRGQPWLPLDPDFRNRNVAVQQADHHSMLAFTRALVALRNAHDALSLGGQRLIGAHDNVLLFERSSADETLVIALNFGAEDRPLQDIGEGTVIFSTHMDRVGIPDALLRGNEGIIVRR